MIKSNIILVFLLFFCMNAFSQSETERELLLELQQTQLEVKEFKSQVDIIQRYVVKIKDSLRTCLNPKNEEKLEIEHNSLVNVGKYYALIIAVSDYENDRIFSDLPETIIDGKELAEVLEKSYVFERVTFLPDPTKEAILREFGGLNTEAKRDDNVLIFYAGHGYMWKDKKVKSGYWCPANSKWEDSNTLLTDFEILGNLQLIDAKNILLISDACHASSITTSSRGVNPPKSLVNQEIYEKSSVQYISSGSDSEVPDNSRFFKNLITGLTKNTATYLSASDLYYQHLKHSYTSYNNDIVIPQLSPLPGHELGGDFFFIRK